MTDYLTLHVNKAFIKAVVLMGILCGGFYYAGYKRGYNKGMRAAFEYMVNELGGSSGQLNQSNLPELRGSSISASNRQYK